MITPTPTPTPTPTEPIWLQRARSYEGMHERDARGLAEVPRFFSCTSMARGDSSDAWCSAFACACFESCGLSHPRSARARDWLRYGVALDRPRLGCIVVYRRPDPGVWPLSYARGLGHVHFWIRTDDAGWNWGYGGNQNNRVGLRRYPVRDVLGYRWPTREALVMIDDERASGVSVNPDDRDRSRARTRSDANRPQ